MNSQVLREKVERGALLLDERHPGWHHKINLNELNLESCTACVLGQLHGDFGQGLDELDAPPWTSAMRQRRAFAADHGFALDDDYYHLWAPAMRAYWHEEILRRTEADVACAAH
jgi:hypothetical protein